MFSVFHQSLFIFLTLLQALFVIKIFWDMFSISLLRKQIHFLVDPILQPIRGILTHSIFHTAAMDISPIIAFILLSYIQQYF